MYVFPPFLFNPLPPKSGAPSHNLLWKWEAYTEAEGERSQQNQVSTAPTLKTRTIKVAREDLGMSESTKKLLQERGYKVRWVYFPLLIETCGTMKMLKYNATARGEGKCYGDLRETENRCVTGAWTNNGEAVVGWAQSMYYPKTGKMKRRGSALEEG